jgi:hypothetical protein
VCVVGKGECVYVWGGQALGGGIAVYCCVILIVQPPDVHMHQRQGCWECEFVCPMWGGKGKGKRHAGRRRFTEGPRDGGSVRVLPIRNAADASA